MRPRFFAGQLLTDEDLGLLEEYVVGKNRLHNRALWGPGVVCGLDVQCDPCGGGKVVVQAGYAINCCGDDIVVPCPEEVDIVALARQLRNSVLGADCADPCDEPKPATPSADPTTPPVLTTGVNTIGTPPPAVWNPQAPIRRYYLYVRYSEELTDPVSPYATDEPCAGQACEPTRVREGHVYELRCENDNPMWPGLGDRFLACLEDLAAATATAQNVKVTGALGMQAEAAQRALAQNPTPRFLGGDFEALRMSNSDLRAALQPFAAPAATTRRSASQPPPPATPPTADQVRAAVEGVRNVGSLLMRWQLTPERQRPQSDPALEDGQTLLRRALEVLPGGLEEAALPPLETAAAQATLELAGATPAPDQATYSHQLFAYGAPLTAKLYTSLQSSQLATINYFVGRKLFVRQLTDCELERAVRGLRPLADGTINATLTTNLAYQGQLSREVVLRFIYHCLCSALNPPCQRCDDPAVLLASVCVQDCVVTDVCEMERRFVITWPSVRYWTHFPNSPFDINAIGEKIAQLCCSIASLGSGCPRPEMTVGTKSPAGDFAGLAINNLVDTMGAKNDQLTSLFAVVLPMAAATPAMIPSAPGANVADVELKRRVDDAVAGAMATTTQELAALRAEIERLRRPNG